MDWRTFYRDLRKLNWLILLMLACVSHVLMTPPRTLGVILGGLIIIANFNVLQYTIRGAFKTGGAMKRSKASIIVTYYLRLLGLGVVLFILINNGWVDPIGLAAGLSTVVLSIFILGVRMALRIGSGEAY